MGINLGDEFPNFEADTTDGKIKFHDWIGDSWCILFSHPNDFTPVCTTELGRVAELMPEFQQRQVKVIALSCNSVESHIEWIKDIQSYSKCSGEKFPYPIISDPKRDLAVQLGMLDPAEKDSTGMPLTCRAVFVIDSKKKLRLSFLYPATTGRNFNELLRALDSLLLTDKKKVATPVDWKSRKRRPIAKEEVIESEKSEEGSSTGSIACNPNKRRRCFKCPSKLDTKHKNYCSKCQKCICKAHMILFCLDCANVCKVETA